MKSHEVHRFSRPATWPGPGPVSSWRACIFRPRGPPTWCRTACPRPATGPWIDTPRSSCRERSTRWSTIVAWGRNPGFFSKEVFFFGMDFGGIWMEDSSGSLLGFYRDFIGTLLEFDGFCIRSFRFRFVTFVGMNFLKSRHGIHQQRFGKMICSMKIVCSFS